MRRYKIFVSFLVGLGVILLVIGTLIGIGFLLDATLPVAHDFFVDIIDWFKTTFTNIGDWFRNLFTKK